MVQTKLDKLYSLREDFSIIGITGRIGSGCTEVAEILSKKFEELEAAKLQPKQASSILDRKYEIVYNFNSLNWKQFRTIKYQNVILFLLCSDVNPMKFQRHLSNYYRFSSQSPDSEESIKELHSKLNKIFQDNKNVVERIKAFGPLDEIKDRQKLKELAEFFWADFDVFAKLIDDVLIEGGLVQRKRLLHHTAANFRKSGQAYQIIDENYDFIYYIAEALNRIIRGTKILNRGKYGKDECHITISSLKNSLEINFFKERYSGFYLIAVKSDERRERLSKKIKIKDNSVIEGLLKLDDTEYKSEDFAKGKFFGPDIQNCIQKADFHINTRNNNLEKPKFDFYSTEQQLLKFQGLVQQPGLITPSMVERCMQFAYNAKLSSGCISRQVGAVITDSEYSVKAIGWNDVPRGAVPCAMRKVKDLEKSDNPFGFSDFEKGRGLIEMNMNPGDTSSNPDHEEIDKESESFNKYVKTSFSQTNFNESDLGGINCPYCFKTAYNKFTGDKNQVHTRSLHAEENAMLQISKYGGQPLKNGILFTTASPCELCSKKAYQLGIKNIYYIDPYPGISRSHILRQANKDVDPNLYMFYGAVGRGFLRLYEPFMAQKDEISILTSHNYETPQRVKVKQLKELISDKMKGKKELKEKLDKLFENNKENPFEEVIKLIEKGLQS